MMSKKSCTVVLPVEEAADDDSDRFKRNAIVGGLFNCANCCFFHSWLVYKFPGCTLLNAENKWCTVYPGIVARNCEHTRNIANNLLGRLRHVQWRNLH